jgi:hypothetical protein
VSIQTNSTSSNSCIKRFRGVGIKGISHQYNLYPHTSEAFNTAVGTSTISLHRHINITFIPTPLRRLIQLMGLVLLVILVCLCKKIILVPLAVLNTTEVRG